MKSSQLATGRVFCILRLHHQLTLILISNNHSEFSYKINYVTVRCKMYTVCVSGRYVFSQK